MNLCRVDVIPARSGVMAEIKVDVGRVRFRAYNLDPDDQQVFSCWSGWFDIQDAPIHLTWSAFDFGPP